MKYNEVLFPQDLRNCTKCHDGSATSTAQTAQGDNWKNAPSQRAWPLRMKECGRLIVNSASSLKFDVTWAAILFGAATGILFYLVIVLIERLVIPWAATMRADS